MIKCTLHGTDSFFSFRSQFIYSKSPQVTFLTESRLQVDFKTVLVQVKSVSPNKVTPRSAGQEVTIFLTVRCKFPTEDITVAQNFNFAISFPTMGFSASNVAFLEESFWTRRKYSISPKFRVIALPPCLICRAATWSLKWPKVPFLNTWSLMSLNVKKWSLKSLFLCNWLFFNLSRLNFAFIF